MAVSREQSLYGRRRSNTAQSNFRAVPTFVVPISIGESKVLNAWVHDVKETQSVVFNHSFWPGVQEGDCLKVSGSNVENPEAGFLFIVPREDYCPKPQLQISIPRPIADVFGLPNNSQVDKAGCSADYVEFMFQDQYLGRNEMWRLGKHLSGQCIYTDQEISFIGGIAAKIQNIYISGQKVSSACMTAATKAIYRSYSAKITIFIQVCRELWEFAGDGERYNEKIVHSFLPSLFNKWKESGTNHTVTIVLISRVFYDESEIDYAAGPLRRDEEGHWYKDFFKVITDLQVLYEWKPTLVSLKNSFWDFQRDILLTHHYHRATLDSGIGAPAQVRLVGRLSYAQDGPILEALNLGLNPTETHYIDRSLSLTGATTLLISPGTGYFKVSKQLLRLTTTRMLDQGFVLDLILLTKQPLHQSPIFSFRGSDPVSPARSSEKDGFEPGKYEKERKFDPLVMDPLWAADEDSKGEPRQKKTIWWEPFWISTTFWDKQMDLPFRQDRFIARAKMHEIQMLGLLEHDVLSSIEVPFMQHKSDPSTGPAESEETLNISKSEADQFDLNIFSLTTNYNTSSLLAPAGGVTPRPGNDKRGSHRHSTMSRIDTIEESPKQRIFKELPSEGLPNNEISAPSSVSGPGTSPSQSSVRSGRSENSSSSKTPSKTASISKTSLASKLAPSWLFNPFRSGPSEPQTSQVSASASASSSASSFTTSTPQNSQSEKPSRSSVSSMAPPSSPIRMAPAKPTVASTQQIQPVAIKNKPASRSSLSRTFEEETLAPHRASFLRRSPINTPPRDEILSGKRRSAGYVHGFPSSSSPGAIINPTRPQLAVAYPEASLARRWQHMFPHPTYKYDMKWKSIVTPGCLPLTVEHFPSHAELESTYELTGYEFLVEPGEMRSFLIKPPNVKGSPEEVRRAWALVVMRGMAAVRLAQGFQFVLKPQKTPSEEEKEKEKEKEKNTNNFRRNKSFVGEGEFDTWPTGAAEVLSSTTNPVYLSMTNEIHRISYTGEAIQVKRYVRRLHTTRPFSYQCLIWPKLGGGYTELSTEFQSHGLENYSWNRLDMLVAGYEHHFNESLRYWRTRFVVIPTAERPQVTIGPSGEKLNDEEARLLGIEKLAEQFTKLRWQPPDEKVVHPPVRFLPTTLDPALSILDESLMDQLDQIHAQGPLKKKMKSEREIGNMNLAAIAKAMREEDGVPIKTYHWHRSQYPDSFIGYDFVSWLVREFRDVSSRAQGTEIGIKLQEQGLFEHCRGYHNFLDGLKGEFSLHTTPKYNNWFLKRHLDSDSAIRPSYHTSSNLRSSSKSTGLNSNNRTRNKKTLILSQTMVIDIDPNKRSDQAESVILHHDIIHNPATVFHFELQWIGTTARCIEDQLRLWSRTIDRYGLKLVEAYVTQISDIREHNAFQSCYPMRLSHPPPYVPDLEKRLPEGTQAVKYFEYALLQKFGFIVDVEAADLYPEQIDVVYSYRRSPYKYSQFVHRSGVAFIQVLGGYRGFLFLTNRLMGPGRMGSAIKNKDHLPAVAAERMRVEMAEFCLDRERLQQFYDEKIADLPPAPIMPEEPPPLVI
ncbi:Vacuolar membrane-associated protein IML1 [Psilocybe cubensis]|uniref:Vacuolar membrane-associated protein IML1 n=1 Tax=Psilocybe cubensis TaxID=181762 RepID=A0ACB8GXB2_PSICU|nr:Vacuolar membrane-associated protein IML1 [Psilocybe cubensis]KAH9479659.1 Vacuolar membrane-associated protein IML1 [Psilocybe cubensis]